MSRTFPSKSRTSLAFSQSSLTAASERSSFLYSFSRYKSASNGDRVKVALETDIFLRVRDYSTWVVGCQIVFHKTQNGALLRNLRLCSLITLEVRNCCNDMRRQVGIAGLQKQVESRVISLPFLWGLDAHKLSKT